MANITLFRGGGLLSLSPAIRDFSQVLKDPTIHQWLMLAARHHRDVLDAAISNYLLLATFDQVVYLVDFDILRDFLEMRSTRHLDNFAIDFLFYKSSRSYAIPAGAFLEMLDWLYKIGAGQRPPPHHAGDLTPNELVKHLAKTLKVDLPDVDQDPTVTLDAVLEKLNNSNIILSRLVTVLTRERFLGVLSDRDQKDVTELEALLRNVPRHHAGERTIRDYRDATNLAIALKRSRTARAEKSANPLARTFGYILISQTSAILHLPELIYGDEKGEETTSDLSVELSQHRAQHSYPVLNARQVTNIELISSKPTPLQNIAVAQAMREAWRAVTDHLEREIALHRSPESESRDFYERELRTSIEAERNRVAGILNQISEQILIPSSPYSKLEQVRSLEISLVGARNRQNAKRHTSEDLLRQQSTLFFRLIHQVRVALKWMKGFDYAISEQTRGNMRAITIYQIPGTPSAERLLELDVYYQTRATVVQASYYVVRWETHVDELTFFDTLWRFLRRTLGREEQTSKQFAFVEVKHSMPSEGLLVYTSNGVFATELAPLFNNRTRPAMSLVQISNALAPIYQDRLIRDVYEEKSFQPEIQQLRVNTEYGDFILDIAPEDGSDTRYLSIISHLRLSRQVALACQSTSRRYAVASKLQAQLERILSAFTEPDAGARPSGDLL